jgi:(R,R)-butanediol dehydrogenase/meso-butanediol dehydrogenase/diacetyl reductase
LPDTIVPAFAGGREAKLLFPQLYTMKEFRWALEVLNQGAVEPREMVTQTISLDGLPTAFDALRGNPEQCKVIVDLSA